MTTSLAALTLAQESGSGLAAAVGAAYLVVLVAGVIYSVVMLVDVVRTEEAAFRSGSTLVWVLAILVTGPVGAMAYRFVGRPDRA